MKTPTPITSLKPQLAAIARKHGFRPTLHIDDFDIMPNTEAIHHSLRGKHVGSFHYYWDETYFDRLSHNKATQLKAMQQSIDDLLQATYPTQQTDPANNKNWGSSDGHLFRYITIA